MPTANSVQTPTEAPLVSPSSEMAPNESNGKIQMKKTIGIGRRDGYHFRHYFWIWNFCVTGRCNKRSECRWNVSSHLGNLSHFSYIILSFSLFFIHFINFHFYYDFFIGNLWFSINDWCAVLC